FILETFLSFKRVSRAAATSCESSRAEPNMTIVSPMPSRFSCANGLMYSARIRSGLAGVLSRNVGSSCGALGACCGFNLGRSEDMLQPPLEEYPIVGIAARPGNVHAHLCVELSTL